MINFKFNEAPYNPRIITDQQLQMLKKSLLEFGDLSGIVVNIRTGNIIGGNQRIKVIPDNAKIEKKNLNQPSKTGTIALGNIIIDGEKYFYREVDWSLEKEKKANISANKHGGDWDFEKLEVLLKEMVDNEPNFDYELLGFTDYEINKMILVEDDKELTNQYNKEITEQEINQNLHNVCPRCGFKF